MWTDFIGTPISRCRSTERNDTGWLILGTTTRWHSKARIGCGSIPWGGHRLEEPSSAQGSRPGSTAFHLSNSAEPWYLLPRRLGSNQPRKKTLDDLSRHCICRGINSREPAGSADAWNNTRMFERSGNARTEVLEHYRSTHEPMYDGAGKLIPKCSTQWLSTRCWRANTVSSHWQVPRQRVKTFSGAARRGTKGTNSPTNQSSAPRYKAPSVHNS